MYSRILMNYKDVTCEDVDQIHLAQDRDQWQDLVNAVMNLRISLKARNLLRSLETVSFSRMTLFHGIRF
jgi:hypothetical protein